MALTAIYNKKITRLVLSILLVLSGCCLLEESIIQFVNKIITKTLIGQWANDNIWIAIAISVAMVVVYYLSYNRISQEQLLSQRRTALVVILSGILYFRIKACFEYSGINSIKYIDILLFESLIAEIVIWIINSTYFKSHLNSFWEKIKKSPRDKSYAFSSFRSDIPSISDDFNRRHFAKTLIRIIQETNRKDNEKEASFNILIGEPYGMGKSSFFKLLELECGEYNNICCFTFKPWLCDTPEQISTNFLNLFKEKLGEENKYLERLLKTYSKILNDTSSGKAIESYFKFRETSSLEKQHNDISSALRKEKKIYVVLVDDVDRLLYDELMELIKLIRNTADFPNVYYIIAADKNVIMRSLEENGRIDNADIYLQKFFNYELSLPAYENERITDILYSEIVPVLTHYGFEKPLPNKVDEMIMGKGMESRYMFISPRDIKRYVNLLVVELESLNNELQELDSSTRLNGEVINIEDLLKITTIRFLRPDIYRILRDNNYDFILDLNQESGKLYIADNHSDFFHTHIKKRFSIDEMLKNINDFSITSGDTKEEPQNEKKIEHISDLIKEYVPSKEEIVIGIFENLWSKDRHLDDKPSINKNDEFFKYFSGRLRNTEKTIFEVKKYISSPSVDGYKASPTFNEWLSDAVSNDNLESIRIKTNNIVYKGFKNNKCDLVVNIFSCIKALYKQEVTSNKNYTLRDAFNKWGDVLKKILINDYQFNPGEFEKLFNQSEEIELCALFLELVRVHLYLVKENPSKISPCIFDDKQYGDFSQILINKSFKTRFTDNPYSIDSLNLHFYIRLANPQLWNEQFQEYLRHTDFPLYWVYGVLFWMEETNKFYWNENVLTAIYNYNDPGNSIEKMFSDLSIIPPDYLETLKKLPSPDVNRGYGIDDNDSKLFKDIKQWHKDGKNKFPSPAWVEG